MLSKSNTHIGHSGFPDTWLAKCFFPFYCNLIYNDFISTWFSTFLYSFNMFILEVRVECFVKGKWRFVFDCRSLQIRWFLSDYSAGCQETVSLFISTDQLRWQDGICWMASGRWGNRILEDKKNKIKLFALTTFFLHDYF